MLRVVFNQELRIPQNMHEHPNFDYPWPVIIHASALDACSFFSGTSPLVDVQLSFFFEKTASPMYFAK